MPPQAPLCAAPKKGASVECIIEEEPRVDIKQQKEEAHVGARRVADVAVVVANGRKRLAAPTYSS
jgi:Ser-tRNA(Ala) deacylase AlaX